jgi:hypothetical protein
VGEGEETSLPLSVLLLSFQESVSGFLDSFLFNQEIPHWWFLVNPLVMASSNINPIP